MKTHLLISLLFLLTFQSLASGGNETQGARASALGGASVTLYDAWSTTNNIGALGMIDQYQMAVAYENRFFLPQVGMRSIAFAGPLGGGSIGVVGHNYGYAGYANNRLGLGYARKLSDYVSLGVQVDYVQVRMGDIYGSKSTLVGEVGVLIMPTEKIRLGAHVYNPTRSKLANFDDERIPTSLRIGGQYIFSEKVSLLLELDKDMDLKLNIKSGIEYTPVESMFIRAGFATAQNAFNLGFGYKWNGLQADVSANVSQNLGYSSTVALSYQFGKREK